MKNLQIEIRLKKILWLIRKFYNKKDENYLVYKKTLSIIILTLSIELNKKVKEVVKKFVNLGFCKNGFGEVFFLALNNYFKDIKFKTLTTQVLLEFKEKLVIYFTNSEQLAIFSDDLVKNVKEGIAFDKKIKDFSNHLKNFIELQNFLKIIVPLRFDVICVAINKLTKKLVANEYK